MNKHSGYQFNNIRNNLILTLLFALLSACGGGGGGGEPEPDEPTPPATEQAVTGAGVKGPLANANVTVYAFDAAQADFKGAVVASASTDDSAAIVGLALPLPLTPPYIMEITSTVGTTTDLTTEQFPVISTLRTVITQTLLNSGEQIYATPLTTVATDIAISNADSNSVPYTGNNDGAATEQELLNALPIAAAQLASTLGFGVSDNIDFFSTPPLINSTTITAAQQTAVAQYRTAIEALTAVVVELAQNVANPAVSADIMLTELTADLTDGVIDGVVNGSASAIIDNTVLTTLPAIDISALTIPNTNDGTGRPLTVDETEALLISEQSATGSTTDTSALTTIVVTPQGAQLDPDADGDTVADVIDNCPNTPNQDQSDSNNNGAGDVCDNSPVATADSITVNEGATISLLDSGANSVLANDADAENDTLNAVLNNSVSNGNLTLNANGSFSYTHNGSETTADSFSYRADDGSSSSDPVTVNITVTPQNDPPVATADIASVSEDSETNSASGNVLGNDDDIDSATLTVSNAATLDSTGAYGTLSILTNGDYTYVLDNTNTQVDALNAGETLTDTFNYTVSDGSLSDNSTLSITINGATDVVVEAVDISGVWVVISTVTDESITGCAGGLNSQSVTAVGIAQTGNALTVRAVSGAILTGTIDTVTGDFTLPAGSLSGVEADLSSLTNAATLVNWQDSFTASGTGVTGTSLVGTITTTETTEGVTDCSYTESFTANFKYKPTGSENFSGVYATESFDIRDEIGRFGRNQEVIFKSDILGVDFNENDITVHIPLIDSPENVTITLAVAFTNNVFDPATGFFSFTAEVRVKVDINGSPATIEESEVSSFTFNGIFLNDPAIDSGLDGSPLMLVSGYSYQLEYTGDVDSGGTVDFAKNSSETGYSKRLDTFTRTRTKLKQKADLTNDSRITMGLNNPPIKRISDTSKLFIEVLDGASVICSEPFVDEGATTGRYSQLLRQPFSTQDFLATRFRGDTYSRIRCNTDDAVGNEQVIDGSNYTVRILDTGADGVNDGGANDDVIAFSATETAAVVPLNERFTQAIDVTDIVVGGVSASVQAGSDNVLLPGYYNVNRSTEMNVSWPAHPQGADSYQLVVEPLDAGDDFDVLYNRGTTSITNVGVGLTGNQARTLRLTARKDASNGARALAESRKLLILNGVSGVFNFDLGSGVDPAYQNMVVIIQGTGSINTCTVTNNANITCNAGSSGVDLNTDIVSLNFTDVTGTLAGAGNTFTLNMNFRGQGSATAAVTSPDVSLAVDAAATLVQ